MFRFHVLWLLVWAVAVRSQSFQQPSPQQFQKPAQQPAQQSAQQNPPSSPQCAPNFGDQGTCPARTNGGFGAFGDFEKASLQVLNFLRTTRKMDLSPQQINQGALEAIIVSSNTKPAMDLGNCGSGGPRLCCPHSPSLFRCAPNDRFRTIDGSCNNQQFPWFGASNTPFMRLTNTQYADGIGLPRKSVLGVDLPHARLVSNVVFDTLERPSGCFSHMLMQWGQYIDHDFTGAQRDSELKCDCCPAQNDPRCFVIRSPQGERSFPAPCMNFVRSRPTPNFACQLGPREQLNQPTAFIDASGIYGSTKAVSDDLRTFRDGQLKTFTSPTNGEPLLPQSDSPSACFSSTAQIKCFKTGDSRNNVFAPLNGVHIMFVREHNRIASQLRLRHRDWSEEELFQTARKIVGAFLQQITYREFLPLVLGDCATQVYGLNLVRNGFFNGYDANVNPQILNEFSAAAYRFGHSLISSTVGRVNSLNISLPAIPTRQAFFNPTVLYDPSGPTDLMRGLIDNPMQEADNLFSEEVKNHLFENPFTGERFDLTSFNVQRGRDHGIPGYLTYRRLCGLQDATSFQALADMDDIAKRTLSTVYCNVEDIDLFAGGLLERRLAGGLVGPTFACIIGNQFRNLRLGDRFWYENQQAGFSPEQLQEIRKVSLASIMCNTLFDMKFVQPKVLERANSVNNPKLSCTQILQMDLNKF